MLSQPKKTKPRKGLKFQLNKNKMIEKEPLLSLASEEQEKLQKQMLEQQMNSQEQSDQMPQQPKPEPQTKPDKKSVPSLADKK